VSTGLLIAGGVLAAAGVTLIIVAPSDEPAVKAAGPSRFAIGVGPGSVTTGFAW
jgi:hypothetical protein